MTIISPLPNTFVNGTIIDAPQVDANFDQVVANANSNAAHNGANSDITQLTGLTTPLSIQQGGTAAITAPAALISLGALPAAGGTLSGNLTVTGTLGVSGTTTAVAINASGNITSSGQVQGATLAATGAASVGTTLAVTGAATFSNNISCGNINTSSGSITTVNLTGSGTVQGATLVSTGAASFGGNISCGNINTSSGSITTVNLTGSGTVQGASVVATGPASTGTTLSVGTSLLVGTSSHFVGNVTADAAMTVTGELIAASSGSPLAFDVPNGSASVGGNQTVGATLFVGIDGQKPGGGLWTALSDIRTKKDVADYERGIECLALRPVTYRHNGLGGTKDDGREFIGLVADEARLVMPEMVGSREGKLNPGDTEDTAILTLDTTALLFALLNTVKALNARIAVLEGTAKA